ncbi:SRPBCC family protein [Leptothoe spongobia]|uniref:SRPBCC family protein n=1 Tax=Leptothoe spongobia TAU-MAC 1115 TaxID=1967444 RepID=A0A947DJ02_9CYAN|nr:SRPBCC family protein [Leptothoe spongobia]MBT9317310.1 SRPBCC family protein [Leptothoe spongobia TAU-MAC 1115]
MNQDALAFTSNKVTDGNSVIHLSPSACQNVSITTEKLAPRQRQIVASVAVPCSLDQVWNVLTDYESLADFVPNLTSSRLLSRPDGGIRLEQIGAQCFLNFKFCARVILDMTEVFPREIKFSMVEGDFKKFLGRWSLQPALLGSQAATLLCYELIVQPPLAMPVQLIEHHICHNLTQNLLAICDRTKEQFA